MNIHRSIRYFWQRVTRGWDDSDTWSLDYTIAEFALPRLRRFKEINVCYPSDLDPESWDEILDDMIYAMEVTSSELSFDLDGGVDWKRVQKGHMLFGQYFRDLWW